MSRGTSVTEVEISRLNQDGTANGSTSRDVEAQRQDEKKKPRRKTLLLTMLCLAATLCLGVVGAVLFHNNGEKIKVIEQLPRDPTFSILCSQNIPIALLALFELLKTYDGMRKPLGSRLIFCVNIVVIGLAITAPTFYAAQDRSDTWTQVVTMILSMTTAILVIFVGFFSVIEATPEELSTAKKRLETAVKELKLQKQKQTALEKEKSALEKEKSALEKEKAALEKEKAALEKDNDALEQKFKDLDEPRKKKRWLSKSS